MKYLFKYNTIKSFFQPNTTKKVSFLLRKENLLFDFVIQDNNLKNRRTNYEQNLLNQQDLFTLESQFF